MMLGIPLHLFIKHPQLMLISNKDGWSWKAACSNLCNCTKERDEQPPNHRFLLFGLLHNHQVDMSCLSTSSPPPCHLLAKWGGGEKKNPVLTAILFRLTPSKLEEDQSSRQERVALGRRGLHLLTTPLSVPSCSTQTLQVASWLCHP